MARQKKQTNEKKVVDLYHKLGELKDDVTRILVEIAKIQDEVMEIE